MVFQKFLFLVITALSTPFFLFSQPISGDSWAYAKQTKYGAITVVYLVEDVYAYQDENKNPVGIEIDIFNQFVFWLKNQKGIHLEINWVAEPSFPKFYSTIQKSKNGVIGLGTVTILNRRKTEVQFSPPFINNIAVLITHTSAPDLTNLNDMAKVYHNKKLVMARGTTLETFTLEMRAKHLPNAPFEALDNAFDVANKVATDPNYIAYVDLHVYWTLLEKDKKPIKRIPVGDLSSESFGFITPIESDWVVPLTEFFTLGTGYRSSRAYRSILLKHLGPEVTKMLQIAQQK